MGKRRTQLFLRESVIFFGFLNGIWLAIGVNPGAELVEIVRSIVENLFGGGGWVAVVFTLLPLALLAAALYLIYKRGGWLGFVAVGFAFVSGLWLISEPRGAVLLMVGVVAIGVVATR